MSKIFTSTFGQKNQKGELPGRQIAGLKSGASTLQTRGGLGVSKAGGLGRSVRGQSGQLGRSVGGTKQIGGGSSVAPIAGGIQNRFPENPTHETMLRLVFEELDVNDDRTVTLEGLRRVIKAVNVNFTSQTVDDLFSRADVQKKKYLSYSEFQDFAHHYRELVHGIYFRSRELIERVRREQLLEQTRAVMEEDGRQEKLSAQQFEMASNDVDSQKKNIEVAAQELKDRQVGEKEFLQDALECTRGAENAKTERNNKNLDYQAAKEAERAALEPLRVCQGKIESLEGHVEGYENQVQQLQEKERQLEQMLEEAKRNTQKVNQDMSEANEELDELKEEESTLLEVFEEAQADMGTLYEALTEAEEFVSNQVNMQRAADQTLKSAQDDVRVSVRDKANQEGKLLPLLEREKQHKALHASAKQDLDKSEANYRNQEADHATYMSFCNQADTDGQPILDVEVKLREQRYNLDDRDDLHHEQGTVYRNFTGRA